MITVLSCRGIGEPIRGNMLANVGRKLDPARFRVREVPWAASYGPVPLPFGPSFDEALRTGRELLLRMIADDPYPVLLKGYSGGGALAGHVAREIARGQHPHLEVVGCALLADPFMPDYASPVRDEFGIAGSRAIPRAFPTYWACDPADTIGRCPRNSPLRTVADQTAAASLSDPEAWIRDLEDRLRTGRWQAIEPLKFWQIPEILGRYRRALHDLDGYLRRGDHISYASRIKPGTNQTYTDWLADRINILGRSLG